MQDTQFSGTSLKVDETSCWCFDYDAPIFRAKTTGALRLKRRQDFHPPSRWYQRDVYCTISTCPATYPYPQHPLTGGCELHQLTWVTEEAAEVAAREGLPTHFSARVRQEPRVVGWVNLQLVEAGCSEWRQGAVRSSVHAIHFVF